MVVFYNVYPPVYCGMCGETFQRYSRLVIHNRLVHKDTHNVSITEQSYVIPRRIKIEIPEVTKIICDEDDDYRSELPLNILKLLNGCYGNVSILLWNPFTEIMTRKLKTGAQ